MFVGLKHFVKGWLTSFGPYPLHRERNTFSKCKQGHKASPTVQVHHVLCSNTTMPTVKERMAEMNGKPFYSFEYFPPKTPAGTSESTVSWLLLLLSPFHSF